MTRRPLVSVAALAVAVLAAACDGTPPSAPQTDGASFKQAPPAPTAPNPCVFSGNPSLSNASNAYFSVSADRKAASDLIGLMQTAFGSNRNYAGARDPGYSLLALAGRVARLGTGSSAAAGGALVQQAIQCMFDVNAESQGNFAGWPTDKQFNFAAALTPASGGAFFVRGGANDATGPAIGNDASLGAGADGNVAGLAPGDAVTWPSLLNNTRTLVYGQPVPSGFDWKLIPRDVGFRPFALVALCAAARPGLPFTTAEMVAQQSVGVIAYKAADALCATDPATLALGTGGGSFALIRRLAQYADRLFALAPLQAAVLGKTIGGSASGAKSDEFTAQNLPTVKLTITQGPPANLKVNTGRFGLTINVSTPPAPAGGVSVSLSATTNNGTPTALLQGGSTGGCNAGSGATPVAPKITLGTVGPNGESQQTNVSWTNLCVTKTGALTIVATSGAVDRSGGLGTVSSSKFNVKP